MNIIKVRRMKRNTFEVIINTLIAITILIFIIFLLASIKELIGYLNTSLEKLDPTISAVIYGGIITLIASALLQILTRYLDKTKEIELAIHQKQTEVYQELIKGLIDLIAIGHKNPETVLSEAIRILTEWTPKAMAWASEDVLIEWIELRNNVTNLTPLDVISETENLICNMRSELGLKVGKIKKIGLMKMIIK